ncbi:MAG: lysophospholipid acyltransferase family protein [Wenzhouxiangella sp.]
MKLPRKLAWGAVNAVQLVITLAWSAFWISLALLIRVVTGSPHLPLRMAGWCWAPLLIHGAPARLEISGRENIDPDTAAVYVANHQSMIDVCALFMALPLPLRFLLKAELGAVPFLGWYARAMGMILIRRGKAAQARSGLAGATALLADGHSMAAFPEGTRSRDGSMGRFRRGVFRTAIEAGVPVVPIAIDGSGHVMPPGGFHIRPGTIRVRIGRPIDTRDPENRDCAELADRTRRIIEGMMSGSPV